MGYRFFFVHGTYSIIGYSNLHVGLWKTNSFLSLFNENQATNEVSYWHYEANDIENETFL